jgi:hypothetical protein
MAGARKLGLVTAAVLALAGCRRSPSGPAPPERLAVEVSGCALLRHGPVCELAATGASARRLRLWVPLSMGQAALYTYDGDAFRSLPETRRIGGGVSTNLEVPAGRRELHVEARAGGTRSRFRLTLAAAPVMPPALAETERLAKAGDIDKAAAAARAALAKAPAAEAGPLRARLGRLAMARGDARAAVLELRAALAAGRTAGHVSRALDDGLALAFVLLVMQDKLADAAGLLAELRGLAGEQPVGTGDLYYFDALLAERSGDQRRALGLYREAVERSERLGVQRSEAVAREGLAALLAWFGRGDEALAAFRALLAVSGEITPCEQAVQRVNLAWTALVARWSAAGDEPVITSANDPRPLLAEAREAVLAKCADPFPQRHALLNEALYALETGDAQLARRRQEELGRLQGGRTAAAAVWEAELAAKLELGLGGRHAKRALALFQRQAQLAQAAGFVEGVVRAETGQARALLALGRRPQAIGRFRAADARLAGLVAAIPLGEGRDSFAHARQSSARQLVSALVEAGQAADAARSARTARARALRAAAQPGRLEALSPADRTRYLAALGRYRVARAAIEDEAASDWKLSAVALAAARSRRARQEQAARLALDDAYRVLRVGAATPFVPAAPAPGVLHLVYFPGEQGQWLGFAVTADATRVVRLGFVSPRAPASELGPRLLHPFAAELRAARRLRLFAYGAVESIDLHALPFEGQPLVERLPVEYGLDIGPPPPRPSAPTRALIVANPSGDLPSSETEGRVVTAASPAPTLLARSAAARTKVVALLPTVALFHYAGHGDFAGADGIDSSLRLGDGRLSVGDILALPAVPTLVVISACEAARARERSTGAVGVAHAFLLAGAAAAIAPTRPVRDTLAYMIVTEFYREGSPKTASSVAEALRKAQLSARRRLPDEDWSSFRALSP